MRLLLSKLVFLAALLSPLISSAQAPPSSDPAAPPALESSTNNAPVAVTNSNAAVDPNTTADLQPHQDISSTAQPDRKPRHLEQYGFYHRGSDVWKVGTDFVMGPNETNHNVVVIGGNATINGRVTGELVVISGDLTLNTPVDRDLVAVLGSVKMGPNARVRQNAFVIGGKLDRHADAQIANSPFELNSENIPALKFAISWLTKGVFLARPFPHQLGWAWGVAGIFLLVNLLLALMLPRPVHACVGGIENRPLGSFFTGFLTLILFAPVVVLLVVSTVGILVLPFLLCAMIVSFLLGKVVVYRYVGEQLGRQFHVTLFQSPMIALIIGTTLFYLMYIIPIIGLIAWSVVSVFGLGAVVLTAVSSLRRENERANPAAASAAGPEAAPATSLDDAAAFPRAGFWLRLGATILDAIIIFTITIPLFHRPPICLLVWCTYHVVMWAWKGSTLGGIVAGIKIVRMDGKPIDLPVTLIRFLSSFISLVVLLLGFFWAGWSRQKRSWHDIIAGTIVVKVPKGLSLI